jgi:hypothetical protein
MEEILDRAADRCLLSRSVRTRVSRDVLYHGGEEGSSRIGADDR